MYRAVLDTCVLVPSLQRDFLLQLATHEAFSPLWSTGTLAELDYVLARLHQRQGVSDSGLRRQHLFAQLQHAFPGSEINAPKDRTYDYGLKDPDDGHVAHAALIGKADAIVTDDKPAGLQTAEVLLGANIETLYASQFAANTVAAHPRAGVQAIVTMSERRANPRQTPDRILDSLVARHGMDEVADILRSLRVGW